MDSTVCVCVIGMYYFKKKCSEITKQVHLAFHTWHWTKYTAICSLQCVRSPCFKASRCVVKNTPRRPKCSFPSNPCCCSNICECVRMAGDSYFLLKQPERVINGSRSGNEKGPHTHYRLLLCLMLLCHTRSTKYYISHREINRNMGCVMVRVD